MIPEEGSPTKDSPQYRRHSIRLKNFNYSDAGGYFVTLRTLGRQCLFGKIQNGKMNLNEIGTIAQTEWTELSRRYPSVTPDEFVIMPNHIHAVLIIADARTASTAAINARPLGEIVRSFKAVSTRRIRMTGFARFGWQRNYYEHVMRSEAELNRIRQYISDKPLQCELDRENPTASKTGSRESWEY